MKLVLDQEQLEIKETARRFFSGKAPVSAFRALQKAPNSIGYSQETWNEMVDLGFSAVSIPAAMGGLGLGFVTLGCILEEAGRRLCASPLLATVVAGASAVELAGSEQQRTEILTAIANGKTTLALALEEGSQHSPTVVRTTASRNADGYVLNGRKTFVADGHSAAQLIVAARTSGDAEAAAGVSLFLVERDAPGVACSRLSMADGRNAAAVSLVDVRLQAQARLGAEGGASPILERVLDRLRICLSAEMLGGILELFERTLAYLKEREQFGVKIATFQALRHRASKMYAEIELTRSAVAAGLAALDENAAEIPLLASLAKARANDCYQLVSNEAIQMHGGIGVTEELDLGLFLKRARLAMQSYGNSRYHRDRYAALSGY